MTDVEMERLSAICAVANVNDIEDLSDGFHTFNDLYEQRMYLFAALVKAYKDKAWKSLKHEDGETCFGGDWFIVGIDTPEGSYTYHYSIKHWGVFDCEVLPKAKHWDGHTDKDVTRLMSLQPEWKKGRWIPFTTRPLMEEEKEEHPEWDSILDCKLPDDGQQILVSVSVHGHERVQYDEFYTDDGSYLDSGYEIGTEAVAWRPLPEPYGGESE